MLTKAGLYTFFLGTRVGDAATPPFLKFRSSSTFIIATISLAIFTDIFLYSVVVPVLPFALTIRAGVKEEDVQKWTSIFLSVYGAALAVGSPLFGWFADRSSSRRAPLLLGLIALGGSTGMLCAGESIALLLAGRFFQGLSASIVWTVGLALLSDTVPKEKIGRAIGFTAAASSIGSLAGPLLGGVVYDRAGYYPVFAMCFALIGLDIFLRLLMVEKRVAEQWHTSSGTSTEDANEKDVQVTNGDSAQVHTDSAGSPEDSAPESVQSLPKKRKLPPVITLLAVPRILVCLLGCFVQANTLGSLDAVLPLFVKDTFRWTSSGAGLIFIAVGVPLLFSPLSGFISDKFGARTITTTGLLVALPCWVLMRLVTHDSIGQKVLLGALLFGIGLCLTLVMSPIMADLDHAVELEGKKRPRDFGERGAAAQGFGLFNLAYALGTLVGPLWAGNIVTDAGWGAMGWSLGLLSGVCAIVSFIWTGGRIMLKGEKPTGSEIV